MHAMKTTVGIAVAVLLALTGCSASPSAQPEASASSTPTPTEVAADGEQTAEEACGLLFDAATALNAELVDSLPQIQTDPASAKPTIDGIVADFDEVLTEVSNDEVRPAGESASAALHDFADAMAAIVADPTGGAAAVTTAVTGVQEGMAGLATICS